MGQGNPSRKQPPRPQKRNNAPRLTPPRQKRRGETKSSPTGEEAGHQTARSTTASWRRNAGEKPNRSASAEAATTLPYRTRPAAPPAPRNTGSPHPQQGRSGEAKLKKWQRDKVELSAQAAHRAPKKSVARTTLRYNAGIPSNAKSRHLPPPWLGEKRHIFP